MQEYKAEEFNCIVGLQGELGRGGFGVVRLSDHDKLGRVALKCFPVVGGKREKDLIVRM